MERQRLLDEPERGRHTGERERERDKVFDSKWNVVVVTETVVRKWLAASSNGGRIMKLVQ